VVFHNRTQPRSSGADVIERAQAAEVILHEQNNDLLAYVVSLIIGASVMTLAERCVHSQDDFWQKTFNHLPEILR